MYGMALDGLPILPGGQNVPPEGGSLYGFSTARCLWLLRFVMLGVTLILDGFFVKCQKGFFIPMISLLRLKWHLRDAGESEWGWEI